MRLIPFKPNVTPRVSQEEEDYDEESSGESVDDVAARSLFWRAFVWLMIVFGIQTFASLAPESVENYYSQLAYYYLARLLSGFNKFVPVVAGELLVVGIVLLYIFWTFWYLRRVFRRETNFFDMLKVLFLQWAWLLVVGFALFLMMWGLNYQRLPIEERMDLERRAEGREETVNVGKRIVDGINRNFTTRDIASATGVSQMTISQPKLFQSIENSFQLETMLGTASQGGFSDPKSLLFSGPATWLDIRGVYIPFTGEAAYNNKLMDCDLPFHIAHIKAHQRGYAREDEANFIAFIVCIKSNEPYVRYSGYLHGMKVLDFLAKSDMKDVEYLRSLIVPGAMADITARETFGARSKSPILSGVSDGAINIYLRANRIRGGLKNFVEDTPLIVNYMLKNPER
ncbi:MAG: DUF3810 domain-containing protein [Acidobacteriota bacterium]|nr:DUF3810 domain-containing protein [Acidobacteriota bacterium]